MEGKCIFFEVTANNFDQIITIVLIVGLRSKDSLRSVREKRNLASNLRFENELDSRLINCFYGTIECSLDVAVKRHIRGLVWGINSHYA